MVEGLITSYSIDKQKGDMIYIDERRFSVTGMDLFQ
jgi:hypothetical protein